MADTTSDDHEQTYKDFKDNVNMTASELKKWLESDDSRSVGIHKGTTNDKKTGDSGTEATGHEAGRKIVRILEKNKADLTDADYKHMQKVNGYIKRHLEQKPSKSDIEDSRWRYSLMNWGNDPLK